MTAAPSLLQTVQALAQACAAARHRQLVLLAGEGTWCREQAGEIAAAQAGEWCWLDAEKESPLHHHVAVEKATTLLGGEWDGIVYDARAGFDPDAFGAVSGTLRYGGLLLLLTPPLGEWPAYPDPQRRRITVYPYDEEAVGGRFLHRLATQLRESEHGYLVEQGNALPPLPPVPPSSPKITPYEECASADQLAAVEALCRVAQGHRRRPLVLVADRGRGKTAALGLAAARLLRQGVRHIVVTAPRLSAVEQLFQHAAKGLGVVAERGLLRLLDGVELRFEPPDRLLHENLPCDLLLVDEAAAIPAAILERLLRQHSRIAFATTVHGYEGSGRGFDLRFRKVLDTLTPEWRRLQLEQPIRWASGDPLEQLVSRALLLDAEPATDEVVATLPLEGCTIERVGRDALAADESLLSQLFGLLVLAHYRTTPGDLRQLLDGPNLEITLLRHHHTVMGCALVAREGDFDAALSQQVYAGERRLRGNLLPQSLTVHAGVALAATLRGARVMRIAVHPACRGEGLGRRLIAEVGRQSAEDGLDYVGASFGADEGLLEFWQHCGFQAVRVGLKREASSGAHALMVMQPLTAQGERLFDDVRQRLSRVLSAQLCEPLSGLESALVVRLFSQLEVVPPDRMAWEDIRSFAFAGRDYGNCLAALQQGLCYTLSKQPGILESHLRAVAIAKVLQLRSWAQVAHEAGLNGRGELVALLRQAYGVIARAWDGAVAGSDENG